MEELEIQENNPLHGVTLEKILIHLVENNGWQKMAELVPINCFSNNPSIKSSLAFLRKTPWARTKVENMYIFSLKRLKSKEKTQKKDQ
ncbi:MAG: DUF2132 domain-containing protein [Pseudarcicella sp.]|nr:DUF2132 domain-containing protein [Pseudarcicella sp.]MBP6409910.1 DUF2132 domain-containing protein [Pseudarcicella sp.]